MPGEETDEPWGEACDLREEGDPRLVAGEVGIDEGGRGEDALGLVSPRLVSSQDDGSEGEEVVCGGSSGLRPE